MIVVVQLELVGKGQVRIERQVLMELERVQIPYQMDRMLHGVRGQEEQC